MLVISHNVAVPDDEITITAARSQGPGGQHVNKAATAVHLRFDIPSSSLPDYYKKRLLALKDSRISREGVIVIKAQRHRSQFKNRQDALERLTDLIQSVKTVPRKRVATRPTRSSKKKRLDQKTKHGRLKQLRQKPDLGSD